MKSPTPRNSIIDGPAWKPALALGGLCLLGLALRLYRLPTVPLGAHGDVAWIGLNALDWLQSGIWPYYVYELYAPEPVIVYLAGLSFLLTGEVSFFASRLPTVLASALVVPLIFGAARWLNHPAIERGDRTITRTAWLAALAYAVSFYPIMLSKSGQRAQVFPLLVIALAVLFAHAWHTGRWWSFIAAGCVMALANYTYIPARLMPVMLIAWAAHQFFADRERFKARLWQLVALGALSAVLVLPQLITYIRTPEAFFARASQTAGRFIFQSGLHGADLWLALGKKVAGEFAIFVLPWDNLYAEMGRPLLGLPLTVGFVIGVAAAFTRPRDRGLWWPLLGIPPMFLTDVLSGTQWQPHGLRMIGVLPFVFLLAARGLAVGWGWLEARLERVPAMAWGALAAALVVVPGLVNLGIYHFVHVPATKADPATANRVEAADQFIARLTLAHGDDGPPVLITLDDFLRANIPYLLSNAYPVRRSAIAADGTLDLPAWEGPLWVIVPDDPFRPRHDGRIPEHDSRAWVMLADGQMLMLPPLTPEAAAGLESALAGGDPLDTVEDWSGQPIAAMYAVDLSPADFETAWTPVGANLGGEVELVGYHVDSLRLEPGEPLWITLYWRATGGASADYETFVQVWDAGGRDVAGLHRWTLDGVYRTRLWQSGEIVPTRFRLAIPADTPPGAYTVIAGLYRVLENEPLGVLDAAGNVAAPHVALGGFRVKLPAAQVTLSAPLPAPEEAILFGDVIELAGYDYLLADDTITLRADWHALGAPAADYTLFIHVVGEDDAIVAQLDTQPRAGTYPTGIWDAGEIVPDEYVIPLPEDLAAGEYAVYVGWYTLPTGARLPATVGGRRVPDDRVKLLTFTCP